MWISVKKIFVASEQLTKCTARINELEQEKGSFLQRLQELNDRVSTTERENKELITLNRQQQVLLQQTNRLLKMHNKNQVITNADCR